MTEEQVFNIICEEREAFQRLGPAKSMVELWQRKAAMRIMELANRDTAGVLAAALEYRRTSP